MVFIVNGPRDTPESVDGDGNHGEHRGESHGEVKVDPNTTH